MERLLLLAGLVKFVYFFFGWLLALIVESADFGRSVPYKKPLITIQ